MALSHRRVISHDPLSHPSSSCDHHHRRRDHRAGRRVRAHAARGAVRWSSRRPRAGGLDPDGARRTATQSTRERTRCWRRSRRRSTLCEELGLDRDPDHASRRAAFVLRALSLFRCRRLGARLPHTWAGRRATRCCPAAARAACAARAADPGPRHPTTNVASLFRRRFGAATVDLVAQPLLGGIHAGDVETAVGAVAVPAAGGAERSARQHPARPRRHRRRACRRRRRSVSLAPRWHGDARRRARSALPAGAVRAARASIARADGRGWRCRRRQLRARRRPGGAGSRRRAAARSRSTRGRGAVRAGATCRPPASRSPGRERRRASARRQRLRRRAAAQRFA